MITIKHQPIFDYLRYPGKSNKCTKNLVVIPQTSPFKDEIESMRGRVGKPIFITKTFADYMLKSAKSFEGMGYDVLQEIDDEYGCFTTYADCNDECSFACAYHIKEGNVVMCVFQSFKGNSILFGGTIYRDKKLASEFEPSYKMLLQCMGVDDSRFEQYDTLVGDRFLLLTILTCLRKYAKVEIKDVKHGKQAKINNETYQSQGYTDYEVMDCKWFTEICSDKEFSVRGHFRLQPKKNEQGEWVKELIYINEFKKHGYHRKAGIQKQTEALTSQNNNQHETTSANSNKTQSAERSV